MKLERLIKKGQVEMNQENLIVFNFIKQISNCTFLLFVFLTKMSVGFKVNKKLRN